MNNNDIIYRIGRRVRQARILAGLRQRELGKQLRITGAAISKIELGSNKEIGFVTLDRIARALGQPLTWFVHEDGDDVAISAATDRALNAARRINAMDRALANVVFDVITLLEAS